MTELGESLDGPRQYFRDNVGVKLAKKKALVSTECDVRVGCESRNIYFGGRFQETSVAASQMPTNVSSLIFLLFMALL